MTSLNDQLWELIETHKMPADATGLSFTQQLMRDHRIRFETAETAVREYKRFMYLCATRAERNVPSKAVDLVWHLHMQHTRDYWDVFCKKLGKRVHHAPGGVGVEHMTDYNQTVAAYKTHFGRPPKGVWRRQHRVETLLGTVISGLFVLFGLGMLASGEAPILFAFAFVAMGAIATWQALQAATPHGAYILTFEAADPFADSDAGDCGSGDGGGCGD